MYATITITGSIRGNYSILSKLRNYDTKEYGEFNSFILKYKNMSVAQKDLYNAYKALKEEDPYTSLLSIYRSRGNKPERMQYDASWAKITRTNVREYEVLYTKK